jgi:hypothetical protein
VVVMVVVVVVVVLHCLLQVVTWSAMAWRKQRWLGDWLCFER